MKTLLKPRTLIPAVALASMALVATTTQAELLAYDQFTGYTDGVLNGQGQGFGWSGNWSGNGNPTVSNTGGLTDGALPVAGGGASTGTDTTNGTWVGITRTLANPITTSGTYYFGYLIQQPVDGAHHNLLRLQDASADHWAAGGSWNDSSQWQLVRKDGSGSAFGSENTGVNETANVTHLVIKFELNTSGNETISLYVDPIDAAALSVAGDASYTYSTQWSDISKVNAARNIQSGNVGNMAFDEIRIGTEAADMFSVIPEPGSLALLGLGGLLVASRRRRH